MRLEAAALAGSESARSVMADCRPSSEPTASNAVIGLSQAVALRRSISLDATERHAGNTQVQRSVVMFPIGATLKKTALLQAVQYLQTVVDCADNSFIDKEPGVRSEPIRAWCERIRGLEPGRLTRVVQ